jgi:SCP/PR1 family protein
VKFSTRTFAATFAAAGVFAGMIAAPASSQAQAFNLPTSSIPLSSSLQTPKMPGVPSLPGINSRPSTPVDREAVRSGIINETNKFRVQQGKRPLQANKALNEEAQRRADKMAQNLEAKHYGLAPLQSQHGLVAENIWGTSRQVTPQDAVTSWANSEGHRRNLLHEDMNNVGIGMAKGSDNVWRVVAIYSER